jgi:hypothetical protein
MWPTWIPTTSIFMPEIDEWARWRRRLLLRAGFQIELAVTLAADPSVDVHALIELVEHGCPPHLAARILAPIEVEGREC